MRSEELVFEGPVTTDGELHTLTALASSMRILMEARHLDTSEHALRVTSLGLAVLERLNPLAAADPAVALAFDMHDIGKAAVPDAVLLKPSALSETEWETMRLHPEVGARIVEAVDGLRGSIATSIIRHHHERWDGTGYPNRLSGEQIPVECRAFAVVDAFDAMTNDRPYRRAMPHIDAVEELRRNAGTQFDVKAIEAFDSVVDLWASSPGLTNIG